MSQHPSTTKNPRRSQKFLRNRNRKNLIEEDIVNIQLKEHASFQAYQENSLEKVQNLKRITNTNPYSQSYIRKIGQR